MHHPTAVRRLFAVASLFSWLLTATLASAGPPRADLVEFDRALDAELRAKDPDGADLFAQANAARDADDFARAADLYGRVRAKDPWFVHATRRLCGVEAARGARARAVELCEAALAQEDSAENESALAVALLQGSGDAPPGAADVARARTLAEKAAEKKPSDPTTLAVLCQAELAHEDLADLDRCVAGLRRVAPDEPQTWVLSGVDALARGRGDEARTDLERAHRLGLPDAAYDSLKERFEDAASPFPPWARVAWKIAVAWAAAFALLLLVGWALSKATLASSSRVPTEPGGRARGGDALLRKVYRVVLAISCAYYYVSLPIVAIAVTALGAFAIYACFAFGRVPIKLVLVIGVVVLWTLAAIARSLFVRARDADPGERLDLATHPRLGAVLAEVAARIGTRRVDAVYLTPGTEIAVTERGGLVKQLRRASERALILGVGVLDGMRVRELKAILAHEYGHFSNEDTAGGRLALAVRRSLSTMATSLASGGVAVWYNPAWWFVRGFFHVFLRISHGASRLQEMLADRWAAFAYGSEAFERGLVHVVSREVRFGAHADATLGEVVARKRPLANLYAHAPERTIDPRRLEEAVAKALARETSATDSHPSPAARIEWVRRIAAPGDAPAPGDDDPAWTLFADREALEREMTDVVRRRILLARGVSIPAAA